MYNNTLRKNSTPGAGTIQNKALVEIRGLCCFWNVHFLSAHTETRGSEPARDESAKPNNDLLTKTKGCLSKAPKTKQPQPNSILCQ
jgi:hypothetical protein